MNLTSSSANSVLPVGTAVWAAQSNLMAAQRQLWLGQKLAGELSPLYNMASLFTFQGEKAGNETCSEIDSGHFQAAFSALVQKCDALRMVIEETSLEAGCVPQRRVLAYIDDNVPILDFRAESNPLAAARTWGNEQAKKPFNLSERLFDTALIRCGNGTTVWYLNQHHLITDMVALKQLYEVMSDLYVRSRSGLLNQAPDLPAYAEVSLPAPAARAVDYWRRQQVAPSALYHCAAVPTSASSSRLTCELSREQTEALKQLAVSSEAVALTPQLSLFNLVAALVLAYLYRVSGNENVAFSTPAQGRPSAAFKRTIGAFIELFPLGVSIAPDETFATLLGKVSEASGNLLRHAQPGASEYANNRAVNGVLNFLTARVGAFAGFAMTSQWLHSGQSDPHHHLRILVHDFDSRGGLRLHFDVNNELFSPGLQNRMPGHFLALVEAVLADRTQVIAAVDILSEAEKFRLSELEQCPKRPVTQTVVQQFEAQVEKTPDAIALTCKTADHAPDSTLTYRQLNHKANQLAHYLQQQGLLPEAPVALCFERSVEMLIALWGVLKAGGAYIPLDLAYPASRIAHILRDTQAQILLSQADLIAGLEMPSDCGAAAIALDRLDLQQFPADNLSQSAHSDQLAYCLYTSGSTGQPKGVEIEHRSLMNYVQWAEQKYVRGRTLSFPLFSPLAFDLTVTSIYVPLLSGGQIVIYPEDSAAIDLSLQRIFRDNAVDVIKLTPSHLALVQGQPLGDRIKVLILGGEDLKTSLAKAVVGKSKIELYNEYGPTEATVGCMVQRFEQSLNMTNNLPMTPPSVPIGQPVAGANIYLLDGQLNRVPLGDVGEIFIGGPGLARGYLNQPELTAARFVWRAGERLYRTGDLGRWEETEPDKGQMSYLGRCDRQVKLHGIRIELGEIEAVLMAHPQVRECVVTAVSTAEGSPTSASISTAHDPTHLVAYYVATAPVAKAALRAFVAQRLPISVRPTFFVALDSIPLTPNGKVDLRSLPAPSSGQEDRDDTVAPRSPQEKTVACIWQQVLNVLSVSVYDNFFDLGGDSIMAIQIAARLSDAGLKISPNQIFQHATVAELAAVVVPEVTDSLATEASENQIAEDPSASGAFSLSQLSGTQLDKLSALLDKADSAGDS